MHTILPFARRGRLAFCGLTGLLLLALLLPTGLSPASAAFGGRNGPIVFQSMRHGNWEIYRMEADGTGVARLTNEPAEDERPGWSPDNTQIVFGSRRGNNADVYVMDADGGNVRRLTTHPADDYAPQWSADGTKIVFRSDRDGNNEIYTMNADGSGQTNLTRHPANDSGPVWSPLGNKIAFSSNRAGTADVYVMNTDGSGVTRLTTDPSPDFGAAFSPDGARIAFRSQRDGNVEVYVMNADGSGQTNLTRHPAEDRGPAWSPDGSLIAFYTNRDGNYEIYTMTPTGANLTRLTNHPADDFSPDWGPVAGEEQLLPILLSAAAAGAVDDVTFQPADILRYDPNASRWSLYFDASDVGLGGNVTGLALDGGDLLLSFRAKTTIPGVGVVNARDVVRFSPSSLGNDTAGAFSLALRGSANGLTTSGARIDALALAPDGRLLLSVMGSARPGGIAATNDDILAYRQTPPNWAKFRALHGLLAARDLESLWFDAATGDIYVAFGAAFSFAGLTGDARDVVRLRPSGSGSYTATLHWDGSAAGLPAALDAFELQP